MACCVLVGYLLGRAVNRFRRDRPVDRVVTRYTAPRNINSDSTIASG